MSRMEIEPAQMQALRQARRDHAVEQVGAAAESVSGGRRAPVQLERPRRARP